MRSFFRTLVLLLFPFLSWELVPAFGQTLLDVGFESDPVGTLLDSVPGWTRMTESVAGGRLQIDDEMGGNQFLTTQIGNNQAGRYAFDFANPGFGSNTTLTLTMDVWDPLVNPQSGLSTFPRAVAGVFERTGIAGMPPYVGLEQLAAGQNDIAEWTVSGQDFVNRQQGVTDAVAQDTWYTIQSVWDLVAGTKNLSIKTRDGVDPFVEVLSPSPIGFSDPAQNPADLNSLALRLNRGTRIDNISLVYDDPDALPPQPLVNIAQSRPDVLGAPLPSDVQFSGRFARPESLATMQAFHATRNDWVYTNNSNYVQQIVSAGISYGGAQGATSYPRQQAVDEGWASIDWKGNLLTKPRLRANGWWYADTNDQRYRDEVMDQMKAVIDGGGSRIHFDDPPYNVEMALLADDPNLGLEEGVYSPASVAKFRDYLELNTTSTERANWGMSSDLTSFDYRQYVTNLNGVVDSAVSDHWIEFHFQSMEDFYGYLQTEISNYAGFEVGFSANNFNGGQVRIGPDEHVYSRIYHLFDWWIGELEASEATPVNLWDDVRRAEAEGKRQTFTLKSDSVALNRKVIAHTYALGTHMVAPWDVYLGGSTGQGDRFFGDPNDYNDLTGFVRAHAELYDGYESAADVGPGIIDARVSAWDPLKIDGGSGEVYAFVRAVPDDPSAPLVVHLMDWSDSPQGFSLQLLNEMFLWPSHLAMPAELLLPDGSQVALSGSVDASGYTEVSLSALDPYGLLVVEAYPLTADFDMDGDVDGADLAAWEAGFGTSAGATKAMGDSDLDGDVDGFDFLNWQRQAGQSFSLMPVVTTVPEPSAIMLALVTSLVPLRVRSK